MASGILSGDLEQDLLLEGSSERVYIENADRIAGDIKANLQVGREYSLFTRYGVTEPVMNNLRALKSALHQAFGDNGTNYHVNLNNVDGRKDRVELVIRRAH